MAPDPLDELYERHARAVFTTCLRVLRDPDEAADAVHEVFLRALPVMDRIEHPAAWLQTVARHHCANTARRQATERDAWTRAEAGRRDIAVDPEEVVLQRHTIATAVSALPHVERTVLLHSAVLDSPIREVAARLALSYAAAAQALSRARRRARAAVDPPVASVMAIARIAAHHLASLAAPLAGRFRPARTGLLAACALLLVGSLHLPWRSVAPHPGLDTPPRQASGMVAGVVATPSPRAPGPLELNLPLHVRRLGGLRPQLPRPHLGERSGLCVSIFEGYTDTAATGQPLAGDRRIHPLFSERCPTTAATMTTRVLLTSGDTTYGDSGVFSCRRCSAIEASGWSQPVPAGAYEERAVATLTLPASERWAQVPSGCDGADTPIMHCTIVIEVVNVPGVLVPAGPHPPLLPHT